MSVIQETIAAFTENANQFERAGLPQAARALRQRAASLSEYADITEARAAGFATVEEMTKAMGRSPTQSIPDFLNSQADKAAAYDEIVKQFSEDEHFPTQWNGDAVWYAKELLDEYNEIGDVVQEHGDIGEEFGTGDIAAAVKRRFAELAAIKESADDGRGSLENFDDHADFTKHHVDFTVDVMDAMAAAGLAVGEGGCLSIGKTKEVLIDLIRNHKSIPIADIDKHTIKDGEVVRSENGEFVGYVSPPQPAEVVALRVHEELDDAPPPTDSQRCAAFLMNYMDAKFKESSELSGRYNNQTQDRCNELEHSLDTIGKETFVRDATFLLFWTVAGVVACIACIACMT